MALFRYIIYAILLFSLLACQPESVLPSETKVTTPSRLLAALASVSHHTYSTHDEMMAQQALEENYTNQPLSWPSNSQIDLTLNPTNTFEKEKGLYCRAYEAKELSNGKDISMGSVACRVDGVWISQ